MPPRRISSQAAARQVWAKSINPQAMTALRNLVYQSLKGGAGEWRRQTSVYLWVWVVMVYHP